jgi:hypothetical protein
MADLTTQTLESIKSINFPGNISKAATVQVSTGLVAYDLQAPSKNLYPVLTPIRNSLPRVGGIGDSTHWKVVKGIVGSGYNASPWVAEGKRAGKMTLVTEEKSAIYRTIGEEESITWEAESAAAGFEDIKASMVVRLLDKMMLKEENALIGGNGNLALGTTPTPSATNASTGGSIANGTYNVICVAMTYEGYKNYSQDITVGLDQSMDITGQDGNQFTLNGGYAQKSAAGSTTTTGSGASVISATVAAVTGAVAYAWYVGASGSEKLEAVTTINSVKLTALAGTGQAASALTAADYSRNDGLAFDGLLTTAFINSSTAYVKELPTGTAGTGTVLTSTGRGSIAEIDAMFKDMWDHYKVSVSVLYVDSQELTNITNKTLKDASNTSLIRFNLDAQNPQNQTYVAGQVVGFYFNPYTANGGMAIPIRLHPDLVPGTIFGYAANLPAQYKSANVPNVAEVKARRDYYQIDFPQVTRERQTGVYAEEVLAVYAPFALGVITNIANG